MSLTGWRDVERVLAAFERGDARGAPSKLVVHVRVGERTVAVTSQEVMWRGHPWIRMTIVLAPVGELSLTAAEYLNFEFTVGSLCVKRDVMLLAQTLPLVGTSADALEDAIRSLAEEADFVRSYTKKPPPDANPFAELYE